MPCFVCLITMSWFGVRSLTPNNELLECTSCQSIQSGSLIITDKWVMQKGCSECSLANNFLFFSVWTDQKVSVPPHLMYVTNVLPPDWNSTWVKSLLMVAIRHSDSDCLWLYLSLVFHLPFNSIRISLLYFFKSCLPAITQVDTM